MSGGRSSALADANQNHTLRDLYARSTTLCLQKIEVSLEHCHKWVYVISLQGVNLTPERTEG
eukprot:2415926-Amphidinium_carterae.2